jgi:uncharacterized membrane protein YfcA
VGTPQTIGIALGAVLVSVMDYRALVAVMFAAILACSAYLLTRGPEPIAAEEPRLDVLLADTEAVATPTTHV